MNKNEMIFVQLIQYLEPNKKVNYAHYSKLMAAAENVWLENNGAVMGNKGNSEVNEKIM